MTDFTELSDTELSEALEFHRRQRNLSRGVNEAMHMRQTKTVRLLEAEEARRLNEENPNHYVISKRRNGEYGVSQRSGNDYSWDHSLHHGTHKTVDAAKTWAAKHAGKYPHKIEVKEEAEQIDELSKKTLGSYVRKSAVDVYRTGQNVEAHMNARNATDNYAKQRRHAELTDKARLKASNRITGIEKATHKMAKEEAELDEGIKEKISGVIRREKQKEYPLLQNRRDVAANKAGSAYAAGDHKKGDRYMKWRADNMKKEEVELDEESKLRITKVYNKWPKPATYAVHNNDRSYHKEFDTMEAAQAHKDEKSK